MAAGGNFVLPLFRQGSNEFQPGDPVDPLPAYTPSREKSAARTGQSGEYPLNVISPKSHAFLNSSYGNLPTQMHHAGEQVVLVNPIDARARNIGDGIGEDAVEAIVEQDGAAERVELFGFAAAHLRFGGAPFGPGGELAGGDGCNQKGQ